jgi:hypothetical protein
VQAAPSCHVPLASHVCTTSPLHCVAFGEHVPEHAPPLHTLAQGGSSVHAPVGSQRSGANPLHCRVPGVHPPTQAPSRHTYGQVSSRVVVTRSSPHAMLSVPWQTAVPAFTPLQLAAIGWHEPALAPSVVSQFFAGEHVPATVHLPLVQTSWSFWACPAHAVAPSGEQDWPALPIAVPSPPTVLPSTAASGPPPVLVPPNEASKPPRIPPPPVEDPARPLPPAALAPPWEMLASGGCSAPLKESSPDVVQPVATAAMSHSHRGGRAAIFQEYPTSRP